MFLAVSFESSAIRIVNGWFVLLFATRKQFPNELRMFHLCIMGLDETLGAYGIK